MSRRLENDFKILLHSATSLQLNGVKMAVNAMCVCDDRVINSCVGSFSAVK